MSFFQSPEFCQFVASILGGAIIGWKLSGWQARRENRRAMRTRQPQYIGFPLVPISSRKGQPPCGECHLEPTETCDICGATETLTCDRRR